MLKVGQSAQIARRYTEEDLRAFASLSGGKSECVPEPLIAALFSYLLGVELPGSGTNYLKQDLQFNARAPLNTLLTAQVTIIKLRSEKRLVDLWAKCTTPEGNMICEGRSLVRAKDVPKAFCKQA